MDKSIAEFAEGAVRGTFFVLVIHLLFLVLLIGVIISSFRQGKAIKGLLIVTGIFLILLGLLISDGAFAYIDSPSSRPTAIYIFICVGFDLIAGILAFVAIHKRRKSLAVR
jgi:O-antigen ligase